MKIYAYKFEVSHRDSFMNLCDHFKEETTTDAFFYDIAQNALQTVMKVIISKSP